MKWRPIKTAPKDRDILGYLRYGPEIIFWDEHDKCWSDRDMKVASPPTHWMPLPKPPK